MSKDNSGQDKSPKLSDYLEDKGIDENSRVQSPNDGPLLSSFHCFWRGVGAAVPAAFMGGAFGFGTGLFQKPRLKNAINQAGHNAKTFGLASGIHNGVSCALERFEIGDRAIRTGIAGCSTALAFDWGGSFTGLVSNCLVLGGISYALEMMASPPAVIASTLGKRPKLHNKQSKQVTNFEELSRIFTHKISSQFHKALAVGKSITPR